DFCMRIDSLKSSGVPLSVASRVALEAEQKQIEELNPIFEPFEFGWAKESLRTMPTMWTSADLNVEAAVAPSPVAECTLSLDQSMVINKFIAEIANSKTEVTFDGKERLEKQKADLDVLKPKMGSYLAAKYDVAVAKLSKVPTKATIQYTKPSTILR